MGKMANSANAGLLLEKLRNSFRLVHNSLLFKIFK